MAISKRIIVGGGRNLQGVRQFLQHRNKLAINIGECGIGDLVVLRMLASHIRQAHPDIEVGFICGNRTHEYARQMPPHPDVSFCCRTEQAPRCGGVVEIRPAHIDEDAGDPRSRLRIWASHLDVTIDPDNVAFLNGEHRARMPRWQPGGDNILFFPNATAKDRCVPDEIRKDLESRLRGLGQVITDGNDWDLPELVRQIASAKLVVSTDTGPLHLAGAAGVPTVGISYFKPSHYFAELYPGIDVLQFSAGELCPCGGRWSCKYDSHDEMGHLPCNYEIDVDAVINAAKAQLGGGRQPYEKTAYVAVPPGIGDALWSLVKIPDLKRKGGYKRVVICPKSTGLNRSADFLARFDFVDDVQYVDFPIHPPEASPTNTDRDGRYVYIDSEKGWRGFDWLMISNGHLERGHRLENWLPELATDWTIGQQFTYEPDDLAAADAAAPDSPFVVFYPGPLRGNTTDGHNRGPLWTPDDWVSVHNAVCDAGFRVAYVGASYDRPYMDGQLLPALNSGGRSGYKDLVGELAIGATFALIERAQFTLSYQAGVGIFPLYRGRKSAIWWRPDGDSISPNIKLMFDERMNGAWVPPQYAGNHLPLYYKKDGPKEVIQKLRDRGWLGRGS